MKWWMRKRGKEMKRAKMLERDSVKSKVERKRMKSKRKLRRLIFLSKGERNLRVIDKNPAKRK